MTKLKHMCGLTFWMVSLQTASAPSVPAREVTHGVLSPLGPRLKGLGRLHAERKVRNIWPLPCPHGRKHQGTSTPKFAFLVSAPTNFHLLLMLFYASLLGLEGAFHKSITEISRKTEGLRLGGKRMRARLGGGISSSPAAV